MRKTAFVLSLLTLQLSAQDKTTSRKTETREQVRAHKVMLVPYEPKMYMGEIDRQIHDESKLGAGEIRARFRDGINEQLYRAFKAASFNVVDLMDDSVKYYKDMTGIYQHLAYDYLRVPDQAKYQPPAKDKKEKSIEKGQLAIETNSDKRFMNGRITNSKIVPALYAKYKTDVFVLINQLDIKAGGTADPTDLHNTSPNRKIAVHYTVYSNEGREINSGLAEEEFAPELNNQKKIIDKHFSKVARLIVERVEKNLQSTGK
jgi:hypothetical protein